VFGWASCQTGSVSRVLTREAVLAGGGDTYHVDANGCLHLKLTDPGHPWLYSDSFQREGLYVEETVSLRLQHFFGSCMKRLLWGFGV